MQGLSLKAVVTFQGRGPWPPGGGGGSPTPYAPASLEPPPLIRQGSPGSPKGCHSEFVPVGQDCPVPAASSIKAAGAPVWPKRPSQTGGPALGPGGGAPDTGKVEGSKGESEWRRGPAVATGSVFPTHPDPWDSTQAKAGGRWKAILPCPSGPHTHTAQVKVCSGKLGDPSPHRGRG